MSKRRRSRGKLPPGLYRRPGSSRIYIDIRIGKSGKRFRRSARTADIEEARALLAKLTKERFLEEHFDKKPPLPFLDALNRYAVTHKRDHHRSFMNSTRYRLRELGDWFSSYNVGDISPAVITAYMDGRLQRVAPTTVRREVSVLRAILNRTWRDDLLDLQPRFPKLPGDKKRGRFLAIDEEEALIRVASLHLVPIIRFAIYTGGRKGEILGLDWRDVCLDRAQVTFRETKNGEDRHVPLPRPALAVLSALEQKLEGPVFTYRGKPIKDIKTAFNHARRSANLIDLRFHDLRHTYASRLVQAAVPLYDVMHLMGHKSLDMVQRYAHLAPDHLRGAVSVLDAFGHTLDTPGKPAPEEAILGVPTPMKRKEKMAHPARFERATSAFGEESIEGNGRKSLVRSRFPGVMKAAFDGLSGDETGMCII